MANSRDRADSSRDGVGSLASSQVRVDSLVNLKGVGAAAVAQGLRSVAGINAEIRSPRIT